MLLSAAPSHLLEISPIRRNDITREGRFRVMTGAEGETTVSEEHGEQKDRWSEAQRQEGGMIYLRESAGFLLNKLLPQILGA